MSGADHRPAIEHALAGIDKKPVTRWLAGHVHGLVPPVDFDLISGGRSNLTYRVTDAAGAVYALRRPPTGGVLATAHDMSREWRFISAMAPTAVPVAAPLAYCADADVTGAEFYVMGYVDGQVLADRDSGLALALGARATAGEQVVDVLVALHALDPAEAGLGDLVRRTGYVERQLRRWHAQVHASETAEHTSPQSLALLDEVHGLLARRVPAQGNGVVHGDFRPGNMAFGPEGTVRAVFDWELATTGDPMADLGWLASTWEDPGDEVPPATPGPSTAPGFPPRAGIVARYARASGRDVSDLAYWVAFCRWRSACIGAGVRARYVSGRMADDGYLQEALKRGDDGIRLAEAAREALRLLHAQREKRSQMTWDFSTEPEFEEKLAWMRGFVRDEIIPLETLALDATAFARATSPLKDEVKAQGLWAAHLPPELGGGGFGQVKLGLMHEILGQCGYAPAIFGNNAPDSGNAELLALGANDEQKKKWLEPLLAGQVRSAFSMTEPGAGADPTLLATRAVRDGDEYVINGHKWFTSNGSVADFLILMAVTDPEAPARKRATMFVVPANTPGVDVLRDIETMGDIGGHRGRPGGHSEITYTDVRVPAANRIGAEGDGFLLAQQRLGPGRIHHCMRWLGQSKRAFDMLCERAKSRYTHGSLLADKQMIQDWIATSAAEMTAARLMTLQAAWKMDNGGTAAALTDIAMIKFYGAQVLYNVIDRAIQIHGSLGYTTDLPLESMYRHARAARIYDGPDEVHKVTVARRILRNYEARDVPTEHVPTRRAEAEKKFAHLLDTTAINS